MAYSDTTSMAYLQALARDKTTRGREALTQAIGDLYVTRSNDLSETECALVGSILERLVVEVEQSVRHTLARRLATVATAPRDVILALANDVIDVARPLLVQSSVLTDTDLIDIIRTRGEEHQLAVAVRARLSEGVAEELVATDSTPVIITLLNNADARISSHTMAYLVDQSRRVTEYQQPLVARSELTPELVQRLYRWVSAGLKAHLLEHFKIDPLLLDKAMDETGHELAANHPAPAQAREDALAERLAAVGSLTPSLIVQALRDAEIPLFMALFAAMTGIAKPIVRRIVAAPGGEVLCIASKAAGIDRTSFASIYLLTRKMVRRNECGHLSDMAGILSLYDRVGSDAATALLRRWRQMGKAPQHVQPREDETLPLERDS